jgi:type II secretory pathway component PulK
VVVESPLTIGCSIQVTPAGTRLDINSTSEDGLRALLDESGTSAAGADSLVDALIDWRDPDNEPRPLGAETAWYESKHRPAPRNGPFASSLELRLVRGAEKVAGLDTLVGVERERIWLDRAPLAVVATLPGMTTEALGKLEERRNAGRPIGDLAAIADGLSPPAKDALLSHYAQLVSLTTPVPEAWVLLAKTTSGSPAVSSTIEIRLIRAGTRAAIVRRRTWP